MSESPRPSTPGLCAGCGKFARWHCGNTRCRYVVCDNEECRLVREWDSGRGFVRAKGFPILDPDKKVNPLSMPKEPNELRMLIVEDLEPLEDGD